MRPRFFKNVRMADNFFLANRGFIMYRNVFLIGMLALALAGCNYFDFGEPMPEG
jgi:hypothetical protein